MNWIADVAPQIFVFLAKVIATIWIVEIALCWALGKNGALREAIHHLLLLEHTNDEEQAFRDELYLKLLEEDRERRKHKPQTLGHKIFLKLFEKYRK